MKGNHLSIKGVYWHVLYLLLSEELEVLMNGNEEVFLPWSFL